MEISNTITLEQFTNTLASIGIEHYDVGIHNGQYTITVEVWDSLITTGNSFSAAANALAQLYNAGIKEL